MELLRAVSLVFCFTVVPTSCVLSHVGSAAPSTNLDLSVRAAGMGRASNGVFWGDGPDIWGNPALLAYHHGIRYEYARTRLVPDLSAGTYLTTKRLTIGQWGFGAFVAGEPFDGLGKLRLDYGTSIATDEQGNEIGTFSAWEEVEAWGIGFSILEGASSLLGLIGADMTRPNRFADLSIGYSKKDVEVHLAPAEFFPPGQTSVGEVETEDWGWMARLTPYDSIDYPGLIPTLDEIFEPLGGMRFDLTYGRSERNSNRGVIFFANQLQTDAVTEVGRSGLAIHAALGDPFELCESLENSRFDFLATTVTPFLRFGAAFDRSETTWPVRDRAIRNTGLELTLANVISGRWGRINDPDGDIRGSTWGVGLGFEYEEMLGFHFDHANVPQAKGLDRVSRNAVSLMIDPIAAWRFLQNRSQE